MPRQNRKRLFLILLLFVIPACNIPTFSQNTASNIQEAIELTSTQVSENLTATSVVQTQLADALASTLLALTLEVPAYATPEPQQTTEQVTLTSSIPMLTVSVETYCRTGPGMAYDSLGILAVNQPAEIIARSEYSDDWLIKFPTNPDTHCWVYGKYALISGDDQLIPKVTPPPLPTPEMSYEVEFVQILGCSASYAMRFNIINTGEVTWESLKITFLNHTRGKEDIFISDRFQSFPDYCALMDSDFEFLEPNVVVPVSNVIPGKQYPGGFNYGPIGDNFTITFLLCTQDGLKGSCLEKVMDLVP